MPIGHKRSPGIAEETQQSLTLIPSNFHSSKSVISWGSRTTATPGCSAPSGRTALSAAYATRTPLTLRALVMPWCVAVCLRLWVLLALFQPRSPLPCSLGARGAAGMAFSARGAPPIVSAPAPPSARRRFASATARSGTVRQHVHKAVADSASRMTLATSATPTP